MRPMEASIFFFLSCVVLSASAGQVVEEEGYRYLYRAWPRLNGKSIHEVSAAIQKELPFLKVTVLEEEHISSQISVNQVYLYIDQDGFVRFRPETVTKIEEDWPAWPEVVGLPANYAKDFILKYKPNAQVEVVTLYEEEEEMTSDEDPSLTSSGEGQPHIPRHNKNSDRVRIFVDFDRIVIREPRNG